MNDNIIEKWSFLMDGLSNNKTKRYKFARIYEKIALNNKPDDVKILLSIAYKIFNSYDDIKLSNGNKNKIKVAEFHRDDFHINNVIMLDQYQAFCDVTASIIIDELFKIGKFGYLKIQEQNGIKNINIIF